MNKGLQLAALILGCCVTQVCRAQTSLPVPRNIQKAIDKGTRTTTGDPGPNYWQNTADYNITVSFNPQTREVKGTETIHYINHSQDTLHSMVFKLYPNLYKKGVERMQAVEPEDLTDGVNISDLTINGKEPGGGGNHRRRRAAPTGTNMEVNVDPILPGQESEVSLHWSYTLNKGSHIRTGAVDSGAYFIAYFFPRIAVYDDIDGWNRWPYWGPQEFYNDFCHFKVRITVPSDYMVWGTGSLKNQDEVYTPSVAQRIKQAEASDAVMTIFDTTDLVAGTVLQHRDSNVWNFEASNVTDFVFATANHYIWKASSLVVDPGNGRRTRVDAVFNPRHQDFYEVPDFAHKTVQAMSYTFPQWPYPYPHETIFDGLDQMEYPMMVNDNPLNDRSESIELTDHEIFHTMFPFYMGTNETKYGWMDEGWATIGEWIISPIIDGKIIDEYGVQPYSRAAGTEEDLPIITLSTEQTGTAFYLNSYPKPGMGYLYAKDLLGDTLFLRGLHQYIRTWNGHHPMPLDFFASMNKGSGKNLDWFWKRWFYEDGMPNLGIRTVRRTSGSAYVIEIVNKGGKPVPVDLTLEYSDGSKQTIHRSVAVWENADTLSLPVSTSKTITKATLGGTYNSDTDPSDNVFDVK
jgi:hypothetical protein